MKHWSVTAQGLASVEVPARNWMVALGRALDELGQAERLERLACEVLPNGTVVARDVATGTGYVVQEVDATGSRAIVSDDEVIEAESADVEPLFVAGGAPESPADSDDPGIRSAPTVVGACEAALAAALGVVPAESGAVILADRGHLRFVAASGPASARLVGTRLPLGSGIAGFAMVQRRSIVLDDARRDPRHAADIDALTGYTTRQIAVVPVGGGGASLDEAQGVIEVMNLGEGRRFSPGALIALERLANVLAERLAL